MNQILLNNQSNLKKKRTKCELLIEQKVQILEYRNKNPTLKQTQLIQHFNKLFNVNIPATTKSGILSSTSRNKILKQDNLEAFNKRIREYKYPKLEKMLFLWHSFTVSKMPISDDLFISKAKEFGEMLGIVEGSSFCYSDCWLRRFKERYNIKKFEICGESGSVSEEAVRLARKNVHEFILEWLSKEGKLENIFNMGETALFYKLLPSSTLSQTFSESQKVKSSQSHDFDFF